MAKKTQIVISVCQCCGHPMIKIKGSRFRDICHICRANEIRKGARNR